MWFVVSRNCKEETQNWVQWVASTWNWKIVIWVWLFCSTGLMEGAKRKIGFLQADWEMVVVDCFDFSVWAHRRVGLIDPKVR